MKILQKQSEMQGRASLVRNFKSVLFLLFFVIILIVFISISSSPKTLSIYSHRNSE